MLEWTFGTRTCLVRSAARITALSVALACGPATVAAQTCVGDCDGNRTVVINELIRGVNIALNRLTVDACAAIDQDGNSQAAINELISAVRNALNGCAPAGGLLEGRSQQRAIDVLYDLDASNGVTADEVSVDEQGEVARTLIDIAFVAEATVGEVNEVLDAIDGRIVSMLEGVLIILVRIPDPLTVAGLNQVIAQVEASPAVRYVNKSYLPEAAELPDNVRADQFDVDTIDHHLAVRAAAAWSARAALGGGSSNRPLLLVADYFGDGPPDSAFDVLAVGGDFAASYPSSNYNGHGYEVLSVAAATFGGPPDPGGVATGIFPGTLELRAVDIIVDASRRLTEAELGNRMIGLIRGNNRNVILNTSLAFECSGTQAGCSRSNAEREALAWIEKVRGSTAAGPSLESWFLHVTGAGNIKGLGWDSDARLSSAWTAAKLLPDLETTSGTPVDNLSNVLVIENRLNTATTLPEAACLSAGSKRPGDLSAIGEDVYTITNRDTGIASGTSFSTPQVSGLAAYVWALKPDLTPQSLIDLLEVTAVSAADDPPDKSAPDCDQADPAPVIDAYAAVLATDTAASPAARRAILDVADAAGHAGANGRFDEQDVGYIVADFIAPSANYSRSDLNGDGVVGDESAERFDLNINNPPLYSKEVKQTIQGREVIFDETAVTDLDILCYYAYSSLYQGSAAGRDENLSFEKCSLQLDLSFPETLCPGEETTLGVRAFKGNLFDGTPEFKRDLWIELSVPGGSADNPQGTTDAVGSFITTVRPGGSLMVEVEAFDRPGGRLLARKAVTASAATNCEPVLPGQCSPEELQRAGGTFQATLLIRTGYNTALVEETGEYVCYDFQSGTRYSPPVPDSILDSTGCQYLWWGTGRNTVTQNGETTVREYEGPVDTGVRFGAVKANVNHCFKGGVHPIGGGTDQLSDEQTWTHGFSGCHPYDLYYPPGCLSCEQNAYGGWYLISACPPL